MRSGEGSGLVRSILFCGSTVAVSCDGKCHKAWGMNHRPSVRLNPHDEDDYAYKADHELGEAPVDPGTYEGSCAKPDQPEDRLNKWCVRECERSSKHNMNLPITEPKPFTELINFNRRFYNQAPHYREETAQNDQQNS